MKLASNALESGSPQVLLDMNYAFARTALLVAAVRLHLFTSLATEPMDACALAAKIGTDTGGTVRLLRGLETLELVMQEEGVYQLSPLASRFLVEGTATYLGSDTLNMLDYLPAWFQLDQTLLTARPYRDLGEARVAETFFAPRIRDLAPIVSPFARRLAETLVADISASSLHVLDVGAGVGVWSSAFAQQYAGTHVTAVDLPEVVALGREYIAALELSDRFTWREADIFALSLEPAAFDLILVAHVCRFLGEQRCRQLLSKLADCCSPAGRLVIVDLLLFDDRSGPPFALMIDLSMLVNTAQGRLFTAGELSDWLYESGFQQITQLSAIGPSPIIVARKEAI